jgi:predicted nucleic acid-binding Zn finger protein
MHTFCGYRTRLLPQARAEGFARCVRHNPVFTGISVEVEPRAKSVYKQHYVAYRPANPEIAEKLRSAAQATREERAVAQADNYLFWSDPDSHGLFWCLNLGSQEVYETTIGSCTCPDHTYRGSREGVACKHILILRAKLERERAAIIAKARRTMSEDFPAD